ncbi:MAG: TerB family tellurite resistance protein [Hyphomonadaceae bacterium]
MLDRIKRLFTSSEPIPEKKLDPHVAAAALLVEAALADGVYANIESDRIALILLESFNLDADRADAVLEAAEMEAEDAIDAYRFTSRVKTLPESEREAVIEGLYLVALADGERCPFEDAYIRHVASLLHVDDISRAHARKRAEARHTSAD